MTSLMAWMHADLPMEKIKTASVSSLSVDVVSVEKQTDAWWCEMLHGEANMTFTCSKLLQISINHYYALHDDEWAQMCKPISKVTLCLLNSIPRTPCRPANILLPWPLESKAGILEALEPHAAALRALRTGHGWDAALKNCGNSWG